MNVPHPNVKRLRRRIKSTRLGTCGLLVFPVKSSSIWDKIVLPRLVLYMILEEASPHVCIHTPIYPPPSSLSPYDLLPRLSKETKVSHAHLWIASPPNIHNDDRKQDGPSVVSSPQAYMSLGVIGPHTTRLCPS